MSPAPLYPERNLDHDLHMLALDTLLYFDGSRSPLHTLAWHASVEACAPALPEWEEAALYNRMLNTPLLGSSGGTLGCRLTIIELREVVRRESRSIDHEFEYQAGLL